MQRAVPKAHHRIGTQKRDPEAWWVCSYRVPVQGAISDYQATMCDVPATLVDLAGATSPSPVDGTPIPLTTLVGFQPMVFPNSSTLTSRQGLGQLRVLREQ